MQLLHVRRSTASILFLDRRKSIRKNQQQQQLSSQTLPKQLLPSSGNFVPYACLNAHHCPYNDRTNRKFSSATTDKDTDDRWEKLLRCRKDARTLLDSSVWYQRQRLHDAAAILSEFQRMNANDADSLSLVFDLFERVVKEIADTKEISPFVWLCQDRFHHTFIIHWREASMQKLPVISPMELAQKIIRMSQMLPDHFQFGIVSIGIILDVVAKTSNPPAKAPYQMEQLMNMFHEQMPFHSTDNIVIYNQLLSAWARSGVNEAPQKMENVLGTMQNHGFQPNHSTFNIQLRYWGGLGDVDRVENLLQDMQQARLEPDAISLSEVIFAYAKAGKPDIASEFLEKLVRNHPLVDERMHGLVASRMQNILLSYRNMIKYRAHRMIVKKAVASAEKVYHRLRTLVNVPESQNLHVTMMDIYARARLARKCRAIFDAVPRTGATYTVLIKLYGNVDQAPRASAFLEQMLFYDSSVTPSLTPFSTVLGAWVCSQECLFFFLLHTPLFILFLSTFSCCCLSMVVVVSCDLRSQTRLSVH